MNVSQHLHFDSLVTNDQRDLRVNSVDTWIKRRSDWPE